MMHYNNMAVFATVAKLGSFTKAAAVLKMPKSSVSHKVAQLEESLGMRLLLRTTRHLSVTDEGSLYLDKCREMMGAAEAAERLVKGLREEPQGKLRISCPIGLIYDRLTDTLCDYRKRYPRVEIQIFASNELMDITKKGFDIAFRFGPLSDSSLIAKPIAVARPMLLASPEYLSIHGTPTDPHDLIKHTCLTWDRSNVWSLHGPQGLVAVQVNPDIAINDLEIAKRLAIKGTGICALADIYLDDELQSGKLVPVLKDYHFSELTLYMVYHERDLKSVNVSGFLDLAIKAFAAKQ